MKTGAVAGAAGCAIAWWCVGAAGQPCLEWMPDHLGGRSSHAMVYDAARARVVLYGIEDRDIWARSGMEWARIGTEGPVHPVSLGSVAMCYDPVRARTVMNLGSGSAGLNETWEFDGSAWAHRASGPMDTFTDFAMAFDGARGEAILFGGHGYSGVPSGETWAWNAAAGVWVQRSQTAPRALAGHAMAFDAARGKVVLFGGSDPSTMNGDTWEWDGSAWTVRAMTGPSARRGHAMAYDPVRARTVLFGGFTSTSQVTAPETWEWDGAAWSLRSSTGLAARGRAAMVYDPSRGRTVLFGGSVYPTPFSSLPDMTETAEWDGNAWSVSAPVGPGVRSGAAMRHDAARGRTILFGGYLPAGNGLTGDTWAWDGQWTQLQVPGPPARYSAAMAYDSVRQRLVLFGGYGLYPTIYGDTWEWDGAAWSQRAAGGGPGARGYSVAAFDASRRATVVYGGFNQGYLRETWEWDGQAWARRTDGPGFMERSGLAYDPVRQVCVLVTVVPSPVYHYETWEWDGHGAGTWTARQTTDMPDVGYFAMDYDPRVGAVVLGAGAPVSSFPGAVAPSWRWTGSVWMELDAGAHGEGTAGTFDATRNAMVILSESDAQMWTLAACAPPPLCYPNCDGSSAAPVLNVADFTCFLQKFAAADGYANCDGSTAQPVLNVADFTCFLQRFAAGCP